jgi:DNA-binding GntR family transcriptional regulator
VSSLAPLEIESLADRVYRRIRTLILSGELAPGEPLRQEALADGLGTSRTPLREALNRLATEGLIEFRPHRSAVVASFAQRDIEADYEARALVEPAAAQLAAERSPRETVQALEAALAAQREAGSDLDLQFGANRAFHLALVAGAGNPHLTRFVESLWGGRIAPVFYARQARRPGRVRRDLREHAEIARLVRAGDGEAAARAVAAHLAGALAELQARLGEAR